MFYGTGRTVPVGYGSFAGPIAGPRPIGYPMALDGAAAFHDVQRMDHIRRQQARSKQEMDDRAKLLVELNDRPIAPPATAFASAAQGTVRSARTLQH